MTQTTADQESHMIAHAIALDSLDQLRCLTLGRSACQSSDFLWRSPPVQACQQHVEPRDTEHVREHAANLHIDLFQQLLHPVPLAGSVLGYGVPCSASLSLPKSSPCKAMLLVFMTRGEREARSSKFYPGALLFADKPGTDRVGKHLGVYRDQFEKWMDGLMEWEATEKQCPASILKTAC